MTRKNKSEILSNYKLAIKITVTQEKGLHLPLKLLEEENDNKTSKGDTLECY